MRLAGIALILFCFTRIQQLHSRDIKVFRRGEVELVDETQLQFPNDYSGAFEEDLKKNVDPDDAYDELVPNLPKFELVKNGERAGTTKVLIVTRKYSLWSTPLPPTRPWNKFKTWGTYTPRPPPTRPPFVTSTERSIEHSIPTTTPSVANESTAVNIGNDLENTKPAA